MEERPTAMLVPITLPNANLGPRPVPAGEGETPC